MENGRGGCAKVMKESTLLLMPSTQTTPAKMLNANPGLKDITHSITGGSIMAQGTRCIFIIIISMCPFFPILEKEEMNFPVSRVRRRKLTLNAAARRLDGVGWQ